MIRVLHHEVGQLLRKLRRQRGFSQGALGELIGLSIPGVSKIENGSRDTGTSTFIKWVEACGSLIAVYEDGESPVDTDGLSATDIGLLNCLAEALPRLDPVQREMIRVQIEVVHRVAFSEPDSDRKEKKELA